MSVIPGTKLNVLDNGKRESSHRRRNRKQSKTAPWKLSDGLSAEGRLAMQLAKEDSLLGLTDGGQTTDTLNNNSVFDIDSVVTSKNSTHNYMNIKRQSCDSGIGTSSNGTDKCVKPNRPTSRLSLKSVSSFSELYAQKSTSRMRMDITDENFSWDREAKKPLGGRKLESTLELVEVVNVDEPKTCWDDDAISELARINALDKCMVWMEANAEHHYSAGEDCCDDNGEDLNC